MKINEALSLCDWATWARPVSFRGSGIAYAVNDGLAYLVPAPRGGVLGMTAYMPHLCGDWESVPAKAVLDEGLDIGYALPR